MEEKIEYIGYYYYYYYYYYHCVTLHFTDLIDKTI